MRTRNLAIAVITGLIAASVVAAPSRASDTLQVVMHPLDSRVVALATTGIEVRVFDAVGDPVELATVTVRASDDVGDSLVSASVDTDATGTSLVSLTFPAATTWHLDAQVTYTTTTNDSLADLSVNPSDVQVTVEPLGGPVMWGMGANVVAHVLVNGSSRPDVAVELMADQNAAPSGPVLTDANGDATFAVSYGVGSYALHAHVLASPAYDSHDSDAVSLVVQRVAWSIRLAPIGRIVSETRPRLTFTTTTRAPSAVLSGLHLTVRTRAKGTALWTTTLHPVTDAAGVVRVSIPVWKDTEVWIGAPQTEHLAAAGTNVIVRVAPRLLALTFPKGSPRPASVVSNAPAPVGQGANVTVSAVPRLVFASMKGISWHSGCISVSQLRYVTFNYWGFDGYRYRGELVVGRPYAFRFVRAVSGLYRIAFRFRSVVLEDRFGKNLHTPGANDYASMAADNSSAFNCRYVIGREDEHAQSPHGTGDSFDIDPFENPYASYGGYFPNEWWWSRTTKCAVCLQPGSPAVRIMEGQGFHWGSGYGDYQHFEI